MKTIALSAIALVAVAGFSLPAFADASSTDSSTDSFDWAAFQSQDVNATKEGRVLTQLDVRKTKPVIVLEENANLYVKP